MQFRPRRETELLGEEDREEHDTFDQSGKNDGEREDVTGSTRVTASSFSSFGTQKTDADSGTDGGECNVHVAGQVGEELEWHIIY